MKSVIIVINKEEDLKLIEKANKMKDVNDIVVLCNGVKSVGGRLVQIRDANSKIKLTIMSEQPTKEYAEEIAKSFVNNKEVEVLKLEVEPRVREKKA